MKLIRSIWSIIAAILTMVGVGFAPSPIFAQDGMGGEFKLSREVHWANSVLPTGDYVYSIESDSWPAIVRVRQKGGGFSGIFLPQTFLRGRYSGSSGIVLERIGEETFVTSLHVQGLGAELDFSTPGLRADGLKAEIRPPDTIHMQQVTASSASVQEFFTILNPNHEKVSSARAEKVYLSVCEAVEREFDRSAPIRPRLVLRLGASDNLLHYPNREIQLKKWDEYQFAEAVVDLALHDMVSPAERLRLSILAVNQVGATVSLCELKNCIN